MNKKLFIFRKSFSPLCWFWKNADETILHLFYECDSTKELWKSLMSFFDKCLNLAYISPQAAFLGFTSTYCNDILLKNHILLLFKIYVYNSRKHEKMSLNNLIINITKVKNNEKEIAGNNEAATGGALKEKVFLEISQNSQEKTCARVSILIK